MPMNVKFNARQLETTIQQVTDKAVKGMSAKMREVAIQMRDLARSYAPVKTGLLEANIDYRTVRISGRNVYVVFIDLDASRYSGEGQLGDYAFIMEEELHPYGRQKGERRFKLGPGSVAKAAGGKKVGGRFLSRAVKESTKGLVEKMTAEVHRIVGGKRTLDIGYRRETDTGDE